MKKAFFIAPVVGFLLLFNFKQKFQPCWQSRYLVTNTTLTLPKIALAVLRLHNYSGGGVARLLRGSDKS